jgi:hypothetical protein
VLGYDNNKDLINKIKENIEKKFKQNKIESNL